MLDADLAKVYGVSTARLNQQVRRNREQLTQAEFNLMLRFATSKSGGRGGLWLY